MGTEADEHERALAFEMTFQRRQWDKMQMLERSLDELASKLKELERRCLEHEDKSKCQELQLETHHKELHASTMGLTERWTEEREVRQREVLDLRAQLKGLDGKCEDVVREAKRELSLASQKSLQDLHTSTEAVKGLVHALQQSHHDLQASNDALHRRHEELHATGEVLQRRHEEHGTRFKELQACNEALQRQHEDACREHGARFKEFQSSHEAIQRLHEDACKEHSSRLKELERQLGEEHAGRLQEHKSFQAALASLQGAREDTERSAARHREERRQEVQDLRTNVAALERQCGDMLRETTKDLSKLMHSKHQDLSKLVDSRHEECAEFVRNRCKELAREAAEHSDALQREHQSLRGNFGELERRCSDLMRTVADEVSEKQLTVGQQVEKRCGLALKELAGRVDNVEHNLAAHTHQFTSTKIYKCGLAMTPHLRTPSEPVTPPIGGRGNCHRPGLQPEDLSTISTVAGSEL